MDNFTKFVSGLWDDLSPIVLTIVAIIGVIAPFYKYVREENRLKGVIVFNNYHKLLSDVIEPTSDKLDRQLVSIFELRYFPRYYDFTKRLLKDLESKWKSEKEAGSHNHSQRLFEEIDLTLNYINYKPWMFWK